MSIKGDVLSGGINQEIQGVTTQTRAHPDDFNPNVLKPLLDNDVTMSKQLETLPSEALTFRPGYQIVESEHDAPFRLGEIKGRTRINLLGNGANSLETWASTRTTCTKQKEFIKVTPVKEMTYDIYFENTGQITTTGGRYYVLVAEAYCENAMTSLRAIAFSHVNGEVVADEVGLPIGGEAPGSAFLAFKTPDNSASLLCRIQVLNKEASSYNVPDNATVYFRDYRTYEITATDYDAIAKMTPEQVAERYPYVDSMTNVTNPYAIVTGGNLLPPFYHMGAVNGAIVDIKSDYEIDLTTKSTIQFVGLGNMKAKHKTYRIDFDSMGTDVKCYFNEQIAIDSLPIRQHEIDASGGTIEIGDDTKYIGVFFGNISATGSFKVKNPMLITDTEPKPFIPQQHSMLAFETELAANPVDGSNPDTLFMGDDGLPYVLEKWGKVDLDGSHVWKRHSTQNDFKVLSANDCVPNNSSPADEDDYGRLFVTKYNGSLLTVNDKPINVENWGFSDVTRIFTSNAYISVHNNESGWGGNYNPTQDEIKAYFLGWRMYDSSTLSLPYNRTDGQHKAWAKIYCGVGIDGGIGVKGSETLTLPTVMNDMGYSPYRLQYLKAKPTVEPVRNYELGATLRAGSNMVEVGSGIVIREKATPSVNIGWGHAVINRIDGINGPLKYMARNFYGIYRNTNRDHNWIQLDSTQEPYAYGLSAARKEVQYFDPTVIYHVTYTMLNPTIAAPIRGTVAANLRGTVTELMQDVGDIGRRLSVVEMQKAEKDAPQWIDISLLSGWKNVYTIKAGFYKNDNGIVHLRGRMSGGTLTNGIVIAKLPRGYGVTTSEHIIPVWDGTGGPIRAGLVAIKNNDISIWNIPSDAKDIWLDDISFKTDQ
ncbi:hypothetical protein L3476_28320 [Paenibacillus thiaminolyticus]|uniref:hypothetical protein n=1 Tax=Paenibacillus thiaminolyticus TaxID=49283 RepID=UPI002350B7BE|nr:hypothetical protein [Paenibacillus thiaminolyticus]WCR27029.1 hypothetical protein L3476_28320 [Paenibacillus thiaminolyticus]